MYVTTDLRCAADCNTANFSMRLSAMSSPVSFFDTALTCPRAQSAIAERQKKQRRVSFNVSQLDIAGTAYGGGRVRNRAQYAWSSEVCVTHFSKSSFAHHFHQFEMRQIHEMWIHHVHRTAGTHDGRGRKGRWH